MLLRAFAVTSLACCLSACPGGSDNNPGGVQLQPTARSTDGETVMATMAFVPDSNPTKLVVFCHGYGQTVEGAWLEHMRRTASPDIAVVSTNYRDNFGFPSLRGAEDTIIATRNALKRFPSVKTVYALGVSLGGNVCGNAITESAKQSPVGKSLYDYWVDVEGLSNLTESWIEGKAALPAAAEGMERDAGGTPADKTEEYVRRSPALNALTMKSGGLKAVAVIHGFNDGLVPYNQGREMATALLAAGIPTQFINVVFDGPDQTSGTTLTGGLALLTGGDAPDVNDELGLNLTGHGFEGDYGHPVIRAGFDQLQLMLDGKFPTTPYGESVINPTPPG